MTLTKAREEAEELAAHRVSALLQPFALAEVTGEQIERLLKDAIATTFISGFARGWDAARDASIEKVRTIWQYHPKES